MEEEKTIESLVRVLRDEVKFVHLFIIAFKQQVEQQVFNQNLDFLLFSLKIVGNVFSCLHSQIVNSDGLLAVMDKITKKNDVSCYIANNNPKIFLKEMN